MATRKQYKKSKLNRKKCGGKPKSHKSQKLWKMKGCSTKKLRRMQRGGDCQCGTPMLLTQGGGQRGGQRGGNCSACSAQPLIQNGSQLTPIVVNASIQVNNLQEVRVIYY